MTVMKFSLELNLTFWQKKNAAENQSNAPSGPQNHMINHPGASRIQSHASSSFGMRGVGRSGRSSDEELFINTDYQNRNQSYRISLTFLNEIHNFWNWVFKLVPSLWLVNTFNTPLFWLADNFVDLKTKNTRSDFFETGRIWNFVEISSLAPNPNIQ